MRSDDLSLAELASEFAGIAADLRADDPDGMLARITDLAAHTVHGADYASISIGRPEDGFRTIMPTDPLVLRVDEIQYELGYGPCVDALLKDTPFNAADLRTDTRWPEFGRRAVEETGIVSMLSLRLYAESHSGLVAGLNMYAHAAGAFNEVSETLGLLLATHGGAAIQLAEAQQKIRNLTRALDTSRDIGAAMGILMNANKLSREQAFDLLRIASQHSHRKLSEIAREVADTGVLPAIPQRRHAQPPPRDG